MPPTLSPHDFVAKWRITRTKERSSSQEHFIDLCRMLDVPTPNEGDPTGASYAFEKGANKQLGGQGWADVWKRGCFAWEYKGRDADLDKAYRQLQQYRESLQNPPLLITSDLERILIHTNITSSVKRVIEITLDDIEANAWTNKNLAGLRDLPGYNPLNLLRLIFNEVPADQHPLRSPETTEKVTQTAARLFGEIAREMQQYGEQPQATAHFLIRVLFCLFAEDIGLLPRHLMRDMIEASGMKPSAMARRMKQLFAAMRDGGPFGNVDIKHFNGGLFDGDDVLELTGNALLTLREVSGLDWGAIEPSIFGTLFERGLDPAKRSQLGAHYTSRDDIQLIVQPVLMAPLRREWDAVQAQARELAMQAPSPLRGERNVPVGGGDDGWANTTKRDHQTLAAVNDLVIAFHDKLARTTVLDPACGSGNFLYVALRELLTLEKEVITLCDELGLPRVAQQVSPAQLYGIELNAYAHELAQATVWIGYIQWRNENGFGFPDEPILRKLDTIQNMDAILRLPLPLGGTSSRSGEEGRGEGAATEPAWPAADVIIGNPPFLGDKKMRGELGDGYVEALRKLYKDRIPGQSDLVCYWFEKARAMIEEGKARRAGLIATQSIRMGASRTVLDRIKRSGEIFFAWHDKEWVLDGAAVRVSVIGFDNGFEIVRVLDGTSVQSINSDLTSSIDLTQSSQLMENQGIGFIGGMKKGSFDIDAQLAERMLKVTGNPNGRPNSDVVKQWLNALDIMQGASNTWIIDFGIDMSLEDAALYEMPFEYVKQHVKPERDLVRNPKERREWWLHARPAPDLRKATALLDRCVASPRVAKHRVFIWTSTNVIVDGRACVFARDDDYFMGVLHSRIHEVWSLAKSSRHGDGEEGGRPTYNISSCFETFPFPWPPGHEPSKTSGVFETPEVSKEQAIAQAAKELVEKRDRWLAEAPATATQDVDPAYLTGLNATKKRPKRSEARTLTNLYNQRPTWLDLAHKKLDAAVADAYGWPHDLSDDEILARLLALNLERAGKQTGDRL